MGRGVLVAAVAVAVIAAVPAVSGAAPARKVAVESDPPGASVYLDTEEDGELCKTPCTINVPATAETIIVELEGHKRRFEPIKLPPRGSSKPVKLSYKLEPAIATIVVETPTGATVSVDDEDKGKVPAHVDVEPGGRHVVVTLNGRKLFDKFVNVEIGDEFVVPAKEVAEAEHRTQAKDAGGDDANDKTSITKPVSPARPHDTYLSVTAAFDVGFRKFTYENNTTPAKVRDDQEAGQVLGGPLVELYPGAIAGIHALRGLAVLVRFQLGLNSQQVANTTTATTFWRSFEASIHQRWTIADTATIEVGTGFVRDQFQFNGSTDDVMLVPDADYQSVRFGARGSWRFGPVEPYALLENRAVLSGGIVGTRFKGGSSATGFHAGVGALVHLGSFTARIEGALSHYSWTFKVLDETMDVYRATGGTDSIKLLAFSLGYSY